VTVSINVFRINPAFSHWITIVPEYLAPGVYVEEISLRGKSIEGVSTGTTGFVGPTRRGPVAGVPEALASLSEFRAIYGDLDGLHYSPNYIAHAVHAFFDNGGKRLYVSRVAGTGATTAASTHIAVGDDATQAFRFVARSPGEAGNGVISVKLVTRPVSAATLLRNPPGSLLRIGEMLAVRQGDVWRDANGVLVDAAGLAGGEVLTMTISMAGQQEAAVGIRNIGFDREHPRWIGQILSAAPAKHMGQLQNRCAVEIGQHVSAFDLLNGLFGSGLKRRFVLTGGSDGTAPNQAAYEAALAELSKLEDVSTVAAPGHSAYPDHAGIQQALVAHAGRHRAYRIAVLDTPPGQFIQAARDTRARIDSQYAALYYPWVVANNPQSQSGRKRIPPEIVLPPSGFVCGIYARNDSERGVHKAPANAVVQGALRLERDASHAEHEVLNAIGVNCLRDFPGRGCQVWGARTASSDPEWAYLNVRRYCNYLQASIERGTQWVAFEPNGERLWTSVRQIISDFLFNEWKKGALMGGKPEEAFFVRCDRSTMNQADIDGGRLICQIGVAIVKPAEFNHFSLARETAD
jgi:hypothetical protein